MSDEYIINDEYGYSKYGFNPLVLAGAGAFSLEVFHWARNAGHNVVGFYENIQGPDTSPTGFPIWRKLSDIPKHATIAPSTGTPDTNECLYNDIKENSNLEIIDVLNLGEIGGQNEIGEGLLLAPNAHVTSHAKIGKFCMVNVGAIVGHYVEMGDFCSIGPYAVLTGSVNLGNNVYVGAGALIRQGVKIGDGATIGMGAVVIRDVPPGVTVVGNPAKELK